MPATVSIKKFLTLNDKAPVIMHKNCFNDHFNGTEKYIGIDKFEAELILIDPKENVKVENDEKIEEFCSMLL